MKNAQYPLKVSFGNIISIWGKLYPPLGGLRDFNVFISFKERVGCTTINHKSMEEFEDFILEVGLMDA